MGRARRAARPGPAQTRGTRSSTHRGSSAPPAASARQPTTRRRARPTPRRLRLPSAMPGAGVCCQSGLQGELRSHSSLAETTFSLWLGLALQPAKQKIGMVAAGRRLSILLWYCQFPIIRLQAHLDTIAAWPGPFGPLDSVGIADDGILGPAVGAPSSRARRPPPFPHQAAVFACHAQHCPPILRRRRGSLPVQHRVRIQRIADQCQLAKADWRCNLYRLPLTGAH